MVKIKSLFAPALLAAAAVSTTCNADCIDDWLADAANAQATELSAETSTCCTGLVANSTQTIPGNITLLAETLVKLDLANCQLNGVIPTGLPLFVNLQHLDVSGNQVTGSIPELASLVALTSIDLSGNDISGDIPELDGLAALQNLNLGNNELVGRLPSSVGNVTALTTLDVQSNQLSGPIPASLATLAALTSVKLSGNRFHGPLPAFSDNVSVDVTQVDLVYIPDGQSCEAAPTMCSSGEMKCSEDKICCTAEETCLGSAPGQGGEGPGPDNNKDPSGDNTGTIIGAVVGVLVVGAVGAVAYKKVSGGGAPDMGAARKMLPSGIPNVIPKLPGKPRSGSSMDVERFDENYRPEGLNSGGDDDDGASVGPPEIDLESGDGGQKFNPFSGKDTETDFSKYYADGNDNPKAESSGSSASAERKESL
jgi:hypothetical protein